MVREFKYRGKTLDELKKLDVREFARFLPSTSRRTVLRQFDSIERFIKKCKRNQEKEKAIKTHLRNLVIVPALVGLTIMVYNGKDYVRVRIMPEMLGHRLGEFALTRKKVGHGAPGMGATRSSSALSVK